jgi:hypothetical protein
MARALDREIISTRHQKIADLARGAAQRALLTLAHHIEPMWLEEAYRRTRKDGAVGVDGVTAAAYEERLQENPSALLERFKRGLYRAPPVGRVPIPTAGAKDKTRPIGIPTLEDKVLRRAVPMVLGPVYEQDFLDCSDGFRPGRGAGWCNARRPRPASAAPCGRSGTGADATATSRWRSNSGCWAASSEAMMPTTRSPATRVRCRDSASRCSGAGASGSTVAPTRHASIGRPSTAC